MQHTYIMRYLFILLFFVSSQISHAKVKDITIKNITDETLHIALHISSSVNDIGTALTTSERLKPNGEKFYRKLNPELYEFIHAVIIKPNGEKIVVDSHLNKKDSAESLIFNLSLVEYQSIDNVEVERMNSFLEEQTRRFGAANSTVIRTDENSNNAISEYLGSIMVIDLNENTPDRDKIKYIITARQLGLHQDMDLKGRNIKKSYRLSKEFGTDANTNVPATFTANFDFGGNDLLELNYELLNFGTVTLQTEEGKSPVDLLINYNNSTSVPVFETLATILEQDDCKDCKIFQVKRVLAFEAIYIQGKKFKRSDVAFNGDAASVITGKGNFRYEEGSEYSDYISSKVIALGLDAADLSIPIFTTVISEIAVEINSEEAKKKDTELLLNDIDVKIGQLKKTLGRYNGLIQEEGGE